MTKKKLFSGSLPIERAVDLSFWILLCIFLYVLTRIGLYELLNMKFFGTDFCLYDNAIYNASRGCGLHCNLLHGNSYLGVHFSPILFLLVPFYRLGAGSWILILVRSGAAAGGAVLICLYARKYAGLPSWVSSVFGISFLLHPMLHMATLSEFHGTILDLFFVPLLFVALESKKRGFFWVSFFLLLSIREDTWLYTMGLAILILWKRDRRLALQVAFVSIVWGVLALRVWMPFFFGGTKAIGNGNAMFSLYLARYRGYSLSNLGAFLKPRLLADFRLLFPLVFLPLLGGEYFLLMLIPLIQIQSGQIELLRSILIHYPACILPFAYVAGIHGWKNVDDFFFRKNLQKARNMGSILGICLLIVSVFSLSSSIVVREKLHEIFTPRLVNLRMQTAYKLLQEIPMNVNLSLQGSLFHVGAHRKDVYIFSGFPPHSSFPAKETEYVMIDAGRIFVQAPHYDQAIEKILSGREYGVVEEVDGFILLRKGYSTARNAGALHRYKYRIQGERMHYIAGKAEWGERYDWKAIRMARENRDKEGIMASGVYRLLPPGIYRARFILFLRGIQGWAAAGLVVRERLPEGKVKNLVCKTVKFSKVKGEFRTVTLNFVLKKRTTVEPVVFYGGHGNVGLDYVEFNPVKETNFVREIGPGK